MTGFSSIKKITTDMEWYNKNEGRVKFMRNMKPKETLDVRH